MQLIQYERICTTEPKAKELRKFADKIITLAKRGDLHSRRIAFAFLRDKEAVKKLFDDLAKRFDDRTCGYTKIYKYKNRKGDNAPLSLIEFIKQEK